MRVLHVSSDFVRKAAGIREAVIGLAKAQADLGAEIHVLGLAHPDWPQEQADWAGIDTRVVPVLGPRRFGYAPGMEKAIHALRPDLVHLHGLWMHPGRSVLKWDIATGQPYLVSPHGMLSNIALSYGRLKKKAVSWWFQDDVFRHAAGFHATSAGEQAEIARYGLACRACVVPNGIAEPGLPVRPAARPRTILSLGRIHRVKGLAHLILAWKLLEDDFPEWSVLIAGPDEGGEVARLSALIGETGVRRLAITGPVLGAEKMSLMAGAGMFVLPSLSENFAMTVAESLILGVPVISSQGAPWSGLETEACGHWVPIGAQPLADALRRMMDRSDEERSAMGERGRQWMLRDFGWASVAGRMTRSSTNRSGAVIFGSRGRRANASMRAASSRGLNGLVT